MKRILVLIVTAFFVFLPFDALSMIEVHGENFSTGGRKISVVAKNSSHKYEAELTEFMTFCGSAVMRGFIAEIIYPKVRIARVDFGKNKEGYLIKIRKSSISISYSSDSSARAAISCLKGMYDNPDGHRLIAGRDVNMVRSTNSIDPFTKGSLGVFARSGVVDGVSRHLSNNLIANAVDRTAAVGRSGVVVLAVASNQTFRVNFDCLKIFNDQSSMLSRGDTYSSEQMRQLFAQARDRRVKLAVGLDLLSENNRFEQWSGHKLNSVEGMRVVRAMIEEMASNWSVKKICVGVADSPYAKDTRYMEFLREICSRNSVEMIVL